MNIGRGPAQASKDTSATPLIVSISGDLGSGKSSLANTLVERFEADRYSTGMVQRRIADRMGITTLELNRRAETDKSIDEQIDSVFRNLAKSPRNLIVDSRMAFHFLPNSFKIKLEVHPQVAAMRIKDDPSRIGEGTYNSLSDIESAIIARKASERERFKRYYNADIEDHAGYDLVINTTDCSPQAVAQVATDAIAMWRRKHSEKAAKLWLSPKHLFPSVSPTALNAESVEKHKVEWPTTAQWVDGAIKAGRAGHAYVVTSGAEWVSAGLKAGKPLVPVTLTNENVNMPERILVEEWENTHNYKHLVGLSG